ncbi:MAG: hypothetical protein WBX25_34505 [Rhodomicrobium sp.]
MIEEHVEQIHRYPQAHPKRQGKRSLDSEPARNLLSVVDHLVRRSTWLVGGDGWAYDTVPVMCRLD